MSGGTRDEIERAILSVLPDRAHDLARLQELAIGDEPLVTVIGKYNHGKSRLLNELVGRDIFAVADKRETTKLSEHAHGGVRWLDAPGLDADVGNEDDRQAMQAAWLKSDIRLFVHAVKEGELDAKELGLLEDLQADGRRTRRQTLLVLSQLDQLADEAAIGDVLKAIDAQVPDMARHVVSATRHRQGVEQAKSLLVERSGIPPLRRLLEEALDGVPDARAHETGLLFREIRQDLEQRRAGQERLLDSLRQKQVTQRQDFDSELGALLEKIGRDIDLVLDAPIPDYAIVPDTSEDKYKVTQAKLERARIQVAYSRACIQIDSFLAGHGIVGLPKEQRTAAGSLNTVMVAVMGVSVKFRKDLHNMFCEATGREGIRCAFAHYYELSKDRNASRTAIADVEAAGAAVARALTALQAMETDA